MPEPKNLASFRNLFRSLAREDGSQIVEFVVALPLLLVFAVGIFDFGHAFNTKQSLSNIVREGARFGSSLPTNDLQSGGVPPSVSAVKDLIASDLQAAGLNDCGLSGQSGGPATATNLTWTFAASGNGCPGTLTLTVDRGYIYQATVGGVLTPVNVASTQVTLQYPYKWLFSNVIQLLVHGSNYPASTLLNSSATEANMS